MDLNQEVSSLKNFNPPTFDDPSYAFHSANILNHHSNNPLIQSAPRFHGQQRQGIQSGFTPIQDPISPAINKNAKFSMLPGNSVP
jgi:hypothetical protein